MIVFLLHIGLLYWIAHQIVKKNTYSKILKGVLVLKCLAVPVYYYFFQKIYGDFFHFDAGKYFTDALILKKFLLEYPQTFINYLTNRLSINDYSITLQYINKTYNWDDGFNVRWIYNDNKLIILINLILSFISSENYFIHALWFCFFSWLGVYLIAHKHLEANSDSHVTKLALIICTIFPFFWFYNGAVLKEPLLIFLFGVQIHILNKIKSFDTTLKILYIIFFIICILLIRTPVMLTFSLALIFSEINFSSYILNNPLNRWGFFLFFITVCALLIQTPLFIKYMNARRIPYLDIQDGGIFLRSSHQKMEYRFHFDTTVLKRIPGTNKVKFLRPVKYKIHKPEWNGVYYTLNDTSMIFEIIDIVRPAKTTLKTIEITNFRSSVYFIGQCFFHFLFPAHFHGLLEKIFSIENIFLIFILFILIQKGNSTSYFITLFFLFFLIYTCYTSPNIGSVSRYRSIWMAYLIMEGSVVFIRILKTKLKNLMG